MITIVSVSYKSKAFLEMNLQLVQALNPHTPFQWIVVQNTPKSELNTDLALDDPRFQMIQGPTLTTAEKKCSFFRSIHHAKALNIGLSYTNSDLLLILDPDCFILMPNWIEVVSQYIYRENIVFFGSPYPPKYFTHYRRFPNAICMFINRKLMQEKNCFSLDFMPEIETKKQLLQARFDAINHLSMSKRLSSFFFSSTRHPPLELKDLYLILKKRMTHIFFFLLPKTIQQFWLRETNPFNVGKCHDTGYKIFRQYRSFLKYETLKISASDPRNIYTKICESILPDRYRTFPRNTSYTTQIQSPLFIEFGNQGEQFFWNQQLFGFHLKGILDNLPEESKQRLKNLALNLIKNQINMATQNITHRN